MAQIPYSGPEATPEITSESISPRANPNIAGEVAGEASRAAGEFGDKMLELRQAQDLNEGSMMIDAALNQAQQGIVQSNNYKTQGEVFSGAVQNVSAQISQQYDGNVKTELLARLMGQRITRTQQLNAWAYGQIKSEVGQTRDNMVTQSINNGSYTNSDAREMTKRTMQQNLEAYRGNYQSDAETDELVRTASQDFDYASAATDVSRDPASALKMLKDDKNYPDLEAAKRASLVNQAEVEAKRQQQLAVAWLATRVNDMLLEVAQNGFSKNRASLDIAVKATGDQDLIDSLHDSEAAGDTYYKAKQEISTANVQDIPRILAKYDPNNIETPFYTAPGEKGGMKGGEKGGGLNYIKSFDTREKLWGMLQNLGSNYAKAVQEDHASITWNRAAKGAPPGTDEDGAAQIDRNLALMKGRGIVPQDMKAEDLTDPLPNAMAASLAATYSAASPTQRQAMLYGLQQRFGKYYQNVLTQMQPKMPGSTVFASDVDGGSMKTLSALDSVTIDKLKEPIDGGMKGDKAPSSAIDNQVSEQWLKIAPTFGGIPGQDSPMYNTFLKLALYNKQLGSETPVQSAFQTLFGNYQYKGTWRVPNGVDMGQMQDYGRYVIDRVKGFYGLDKNHSEQLRTAAYASNNWVYREGALMANGKPSNGSFYLRSPDGVQLSDQDGNPIHYSISDALTKQATDERGQPHSMLDAGAHIASGNMPDAKTLETPRDFNPRVGGGGIQ